MPIGYVTMGGTPIPQQGAGFLDWIKGAANTVWNGAIKPAANFVKDQHLISRGLSAFNDPRAKAAGAAAGALGLGKKRGATRSIVRK